MLRKGQHEKSSRDKLLRRQHSRLNDFASSISKTRLFVSENMS